MPSSLSPNKLSYDLKRDVWSVFGLPVDNLTMTATKALLRYRIQQNKKTVLSTININWVVQSFKDSDFRSTIINSDIVVLDGKPLLWIAKTLGYPLTETVPGSSLIQELLTDEAEGAPLSLFLFGGDEGAGAKAMDTVNQQQGGLHVVGTLNPGFGTIEDMSSPETIEAINNTSPDILLVALGANKGNKWIEMNRDKLNAKVISHLGATINFLGGTVRRAPKLFRATGTEWVWRILQEPKLFSRYMVDGLVVTFAIISRFISWVRYHSHRRNSSICDETIAQTTDGDKAVLVLGTNIQDDTTTSVSKTINQLSYSHTELTLDFNHTEHISGSFAGLIILLQKYKHIRFINIRDHLHKTLNFLGIQ